MKKININLQTFFIISLILCACTTTERKKSQPTETTQLPTIELATPTMPPASQGKAVVCGYLLDEATNLPPEATLFLSKNISVGRDDLPAMMSFSFQTNPRAEMNEEGYFCFEDVEPATYALTLWTPPGNTDFLEDSEGQDYLWIEVEADSAINLGLLLQ